MIIKLAMNKLYITHAFSFIKHNLVQFFNDLAFLDALQIQKKFFGIMFRGYNIQ